MPENLCEAEVQRCQKKMSENVIKWYPESTKMAENYLAKVQKCQKSMPSKAKMSEYTIQKVQNVSIFSDCF